MVVLVARQLLSSRRLVIGRFPHAICITIEYSDEDAQLLLRKGQAGLHGGQLARPC